MPYFAALGASFFGNFVGRFTDTRGSLESQAIAAARDGRAGFGAESDGNWLSLRRIHNRDVSRRVKVLKGDVSAAGQLLAGNFSPGSGCCSLAFLRRVTWPGVSSPVTDA